MAAAPARTRLQRGTVGLRRVGSALWQGVRRLADALQVFGHQVLCFVGLRKHRLHIAWDAAKALCQRPMPASDTQRSPQFPHLPLAALCIKDYQRQAVVFVIDPASQARRQIPCGDLAALSAELGALCNDDPAWMLAVSAQISQALLSLPLVNLQVQGHTYVSTGSPSFYYELERRGPAVHISGHLQIAAPVPEAPAPLLLRGRRAAMELTCLRPHPLRLHVRVSLPRPAVQRPQLAHLEACSVQGSFRQPGLWISPAQR